MGKVALVSAGFIPVSDCVYVITAGPTISKRIFSFLISAEGKQWVKSTCHGVCAKVLNLKDISEMPI